MEGSGTDHEGKDEQAKKKRKISLFDNSTTTTTTDLPLVPSSTDPLFHFLQTCPKGAILLRRNAYILHVTAPFEQPTQPSQAAATTTIIPSSSKDGNTSNENEETPLEEQQQTKLDLPLNKKTPEYMFQIVTKDIVGEDTTFFIKSEDKDVIHHWVHVLQHTIMDGWSTGENRNIITISNDAQTGAQQMHMELEKERKNWIEKFKGQSQVVDYQPVKIVLTSSLPFTTNQPFVLDFPIEIEGKGKVCLAYDDELPTIMVSSYNGMLQKNI